jgi:YidC/Oxa1 family membrane protein insertase
MDPWFILPLIMGATMFAQQMLNPQPADPMQAKVFRIMPIMFTVFMLFFPAGLCCTGLSTTVLPFYSNGLLTKC